MMVATSRPCTRRKTAPAIRKTGTWRLSIFWAMGPSTSNVSCGASLAQPARNTNAAGTANLRRRIRPPSPRHICTEPPVESRRHSTAAPHATWKHSGHAPLEPQAIEGVGAALPVLVHLDVGLEVDFRPEERLQLQP